MNEFCGIYNLRNLVNKPTCFKNPNNPSNIDLILTNKPRSFQNTSAIETGLSDFHKLTATVLKTNFAKLPPKILYYRNYNYFNNAHFRKDLLDNLGTCSYGVECSEFENKFLDTLNKHAPLKKRFIRANNAPFMTKTLCKAIMVRSRLHNKSLKLKSMESMEAYKKQRNYCISLLRKAKKDYYEKLHVETIDNKKFWKHVKPFFSDKTPPNSKITLIEANEIISDSTECAEILNNFFSDAAINLGVDRELFTNASYASDPITMAIEKYNNHPSIMKLNQEGFPSSYFSFEYISENDMLMVIQNLDSSKAYQKDNIPSKLLKKNKDIFSKLLTNNVCRCINNGLFPNNL